MVVAGVEVHLVELGSGGGDGLARELGAAAVHLAELRRVAGNELEAKLGGGIEAAAAHLAEPGRVDGEEPEANSAAPPQRPRGRGGTSQGEL